MTDPEGGERSREAETTGRRGMNAVRSLRARRRSVLGLGAAVAIGSGRASASEHEAVGYGEGGYGEGGYGGEAEESVDRTFDDYAAPDGTVSATGASSALEDWMAGHIETGLLLEVINAWYGDDE